MTIKIKSRWNGNVLYTFEAESLMDALQTAAKSDADLSGAYLRDAVLNGAYLGGVIGLKDIAFGITADPDLPKRVAAAALATNTALEMSDWHTCQSTHCLAGWAIHLSGPAGYALEAATSPSVAGAMLMPALTCLTPPTTRRAHG